MQANPARRLRLETKVGIPAAALPSIGLERFLTPRRRRSTPRARLGLRAEEHRLMTAPEADPYGSLWTVGAVFPWPWHLTRRPRRDCSIEVISTR
jgi:hypothetical protein